MGRPFIYLIKAGELILAAWARRFFVQDRVYDILGNLLDSQRPYLIQNKGKVYELINYDNN